ncbi:MAG: hypothetical protein ACRDRL_24850 [Sciscionella sp.]
MVASVTPKTFNLGPDASVIFIWTPTGAQVAAGDIGLLMEFSAEQQVDTQKVVPITNGGQSANANLYTGWSGNLNFTRVNGSLTALFCIQEANYYQGQRANWDMIVGVSNAYDGTVDEYLFQLCSFKAGQFGNFQTRSPVEQSMGFEASTCQLLSASSYPIPLVA